MAALIRSQGWNALSTYEAGQSGSSDPLQLQFAAERGMAVLTHNRDDYLALAADWAAKGRNHAGIIIAVRRPIYEVARRLLIILDYTTADEMDNQVFYI